MAFPGISREERAAKARGGISTHFNSKQQAFLNFVPSQYVKVGVHELDKEKLPSLLKLKYKNALIDATADSGAAKEIRKVFVGFQKYLYQEDAA